MGESPDPQLRTRFERGYVLALAIGSAVVSVLPNLIALLISPPGTAYQGFQWATDDQYVYAAWMRQAMEGGFFMDNRFATDAQPGLTIHLYFFVLGILAKVTGIPVAMALSKMAFSALFVILAHRLIRRVTPDTYTTKLALAVTVLGGGIGFMVWENFGPELERSGPFASFLMSLGVPGAPNDVWQPEAFVFPSMLTNGLFMVSLCLMVGIFLSFLDARDSWKPVLPGAMMVALLMNIHSYDVLLIALVMVAFLAMQLARRSVDVGWVMRSVVIASGAIPPALWFMHVLNNDRVFQERAATPTYSPNFKILIFGYVLLIGLAALALVRSGKTGDRKRWLGVGIFTICLFGLFVASPSIASDGYFMSLPVWVAVFAAMTVAAAMMATESTSLNIVLAWAVVGLVAPYFPALFERKLTMGLSVPWSILAAIGIAAIARDRDRSRRNLITALSLLVIGGTSLRWFFREIELAKLNVSNTTVHSVYLSRDVQSILAYLNTQKVASRRTVAIALPGFAQKDGQNPDSFLTPMVPDLNPVISGLTGAYTYAGHWSETPKYIERRNEVTRLYLPETNDGDRHAIIAKTGADFVVAPDPSAFPFVADLAPYGEIVAGGNQFRLIRIRKN